MVAMADGTLAMSPEEAVVRWRQFARSLHDGKQADIHELAARADAVTDEFKDIARVPEAVPTLPETGKLYSKLRPGRACGEDALPPDLFVRFPKQLAAVMHPIQTKAALTLAEPLQWRGGMLAFFAKDQAAPASVAAECSKNREIVLADVAGKAYHKCRRQRAVPFL